MRTGRFVFYFRTVRASRAAARLNNSPSRAKISPTHSLFGAASFRVGKMQSPRRSRRCDLHDDAMAFFLPWPRAARTHADVSRFL